MKYRNKKTEVNGITFDSKAEASRWMDLVLLQKAGQISELERQVPIKLIDGVKLPNERLARPAIRLVVDFCYVMCGEKIYEDTKGMETPLSRAKRHMAKVLCGIDVRVTE